MPRQTTVGSKSIVFSDRQSGRPSAPILHDTISLFWV